MFQISTNYQKFLSQIRCSCEIVYNFRIKSRMFKEYILLILSKSNLIKIIFLIAPGFVLEARHNKTESN